MVSHTRSIVSQIKASRYLFYSQRVSENDEWPLSEFIKTTQKDTKDLGEKMHHAFQHCLNKGHRKILILGSDCFDLNVNIVNEAIESLHKSPVVIGPAFDGGYYALGVNFENTETLKSRLLDKLFIGKEWSHPQVFKQAVDACQSLNIPYLTLPTLSDIDYYEDLRDELLDLIKD